VKKNLKLNTILAVKAIVIVITYLLHNGSASLLKKQA